MGRVTVVELMVEELFEEYVLEEEYINFRGFLNAETDLSESEIDRCVEIIKGEKK